MGLQVWLPLINDLSNQGLTNVVATNNGATLNTSGKIGGCYSFNGTNNYLSMPYNFYNNKYSVCAWVYTNSSTATQTIVCDRTSVGSGFSTFLIGGKLRVDCGGNNLQWTTSYSYPINTWFHVAITYDGGVVHYYINGEFKESKTQAIASAYWGNVTSVGASQANGSGYGNYLNGMLNDVRIYDYCLSPREVNEISKGLVLHYPLAMPGQENIIANTSHEIACTYPASGVKDYYSVKTKSVPNETQYTLSFEARSTVDGDHLRTHFYSPNTTTTCESSQGIIKTASDGNMDFTLTTEWRRYWVVYTQTETTAIKSVICPRLCSPASYPSSQSGTGTVYVRNQKLERGPHPTPWIPNPSDTEYSILGFNDGIEYDVSGYNHNGTKVGVVVASADTPRYSTSSSFDGSSYIINNTSTIHLSNEFTISWWGKINTWRKVWEGMFLLQNTTALNSASGTYSIANAIHASTANKMTLTFRQGGTNYPFDHYEWTYTVGTWGHYACTYKDGVIIMYQNGVQTYTATIDNNSSGDYYYTIGKRVSNCNCQMSDFRIYTTALSADDILELYHTPETLSYNGTLLTQGEYVES